MVLLHRRVGTVGGWRLAGFVLLVALAALPGTLLVLRATLASAPLWTSGPLGAVLVLGLGTLLAAVSYLALAWLLRLGPVRDGLTRAGRLVRGRRSRVP